MRSVLMALVLILVIFCPVFANHPQQSDKPRVALVLSGGGAKGLAHVGAIRVLEKAGIEPDIVTGTSMGAIIGALYAIGYDADTMEKLITEQNWTDLFAGTTTRREISILEKDDQGRFVGSFPIYGTRVSLPAGVLAGQKVSRLLSRLTWSVHHIEDYDQMQRRFRCVATDIETGQAMVLNHGFIAEAIRASMAIPSIFTPVQWKDKLLIDGGVIRNLPVQEALDMGADIIIAVDVTNPLYPKKELDTFVEILNQTINYRTVETTKTQIPLCDIYMRPDIDYYQIIDFTKADSLIKYGEMEAMKHLPRLRSLADSLKSLGVDNHIFEPATEYSPVLISDIDVMGLKRVSKDLVISSLSLSLPAKVGPNVLDEAIDRVYGTRFFERASYQVKSDSSGYRLVIHVQEKTANLLNFGLNYTNRHDASILLNATFRNLLGHGSKLSFENRLGHNREFRASYFRHTNVKPGIGIGLEFRAYEIDFDCFQDHVRHTRYDLFNISSGLVLQTVISQSSTFGFKIQRQRTILDPSIIANPEMDKDKTSIYFNMLFFFRLDSFDHLIFPTSGSGLYMEAKRFSDINNSVPGTDHFMRYFLHFKHASRLSNHFSMHYSLINGHIDDPNVPIDQLFYFGGYHHYENYMFVFQGLDYMEIAAHNLLIAKIGLQAKLPFSNYLLFDINAGMWHERYRDLLSKGDHIISGGLTWGMDTPLGPITATIATNHVEKDLEMNLCIGHWF